MEADPVEPMRESVHEARLASLVAVIRRAPGEVMRLPSRERQIAELAIAGEDVHVISQRAGIGEAAVWDFLDNLARNIAGTLPERPRETAGLGADLDPGVTGGYGDTGFGEPPVSDVERPEEHKSGR